MLVCPTGWTHAGSRLQAAPHSLSPSPVPSLLVFPTGLTHAGVWATGCSYLTQIVPVSNRPTAQMILQSLHHAVGRGCGTIIGGALINSYG